MEHFNGVVAAPAIGARTKAPAAIIASPITDVDTIFLILFLIFCIAVYTINYFGFSHKTKGHKNR